MKEIKRLKGISMLEEKYSSELKPRKI